MQIQQFTNNICHFSRSEPVPHSLPYLVDPHITTVKQWKLRQLIYKLVGRAALGDRFQRLWVQSPIWARDVFSFSMWFHFLSSALTQKELFGIFFQHFNLSHKYFYDLEVPSPG